MIEYIGLSGFARSGKDSAADYISLKYGHQKVSFSTPMKEALVRLNPLIRIVDPMDSDTMGGSTLAEAVDVFGWEDLKQVSPDVRGYIQRMGPEVGRQMFGNDVWVNRTFDEIDGERLVVFADVRFQNEIAYIQKHGGYVVRVKRGDEPDWYKIAEEANAGFQKAKNTMRDLGIHQSEWDWIGSKFDAEIHNNGTLDDLGKSVESLLRNLRK